jgi:transcriptional regulator with XRE-family HTH domain
MGTRIGIAERARRQMSEDDRRTRADISQARRSAGLSHDAVGAACGISGSAEWRIEHGVTRVVDVRTLACLGAAVGLDVRLRAFPAGDPIRDAGQQRLLGRFRRRVHPGLSWRAEVPLPIEGDRRAWDALIRGEGWVVAVEAETVLDDLQAVERRVALKRRDGGVDDVILLVADTRRNRRALAAAPHASPGFSRNARSALQSIAAGRGPVAGCIVML